jgi:predicted transcriptional regulator
MAASLTPVAALIAAPRRRAEEPAPGDLPPRRPRDRLTRQPVSGLAMSSETISFRIEAGKRVALDELASTLERDRNALINEALDAYLEVHRWQVEHIKRALADAESGAAGVPHEEVFQRLRARIDRSRDASD